MRQSLFTLLSVLMTVGLLTACNDAFMNRLPQTEIGAESYFNTEEDLRMYLYGLVNTPGYDYVGDAGTDDQATTDMVELKSLMLSTNPTSATVTTEWNWERLYKINFFMEHFSKANISAEQLAHYEGIARYYRANFYLDKVKKYSDVPWYNKTLTTNDPDLYKARDSRADVVDRIFEDYQYALDHVKVNEHKGFIDKWIVAATMARAALYEGTYRKYHDELKLESSANRFLELAASTASLIMEEGGFALHNTGNPEKDYHTLFNSLELSSNSEMIQARYYESSVASNGFWAYMFGNYIPSPTKDLVQSYLMKDGSYYSAQPGYQQKQFVEEFVDRDPRMYQTLAYPGWELINTMNYAPGAGIYVQNLSKNFSGYHQIKGFINNKDQDYYNSIDYPVIRYAEVLLTYAEAQAEMERLTQGDLDRSINLIRQRAGMPGMPLSPVADPVLQAAFPGVSPQLLEIRRERRVELVFEGHRFDDLMRWKAGKLLEKVPEGLYFPSLGKFDLTGDGVENIILIPSSQSIPAEADKEVNALGEKLVYYRTGTIDDPNATVYLEHGTHGAIKTMKDAGTFVDPKYYYRPVPRNQVELNPNLAPQLFGWE